MRWPIIHVAWQAKSVPQDCPEARLTPIEESFTKARLSWVARSTVGISIETVEKHRQHLMSKLDLHDTAGLTRYAIAAGIIESPVQVTII
jgi:hypothetical protein